MLKREEFLSARFEEVKAAITERAEAGADIIICPFCGHPALLVGAGALCFVCGSGKNDAQNYAEEYARRSAPWMSSDEYYSTQWAAVCTECDQRACVTAPDELKARCTDTVIENERIELEPGMDIEPWYCFNCAAVFDSLDIIECTRCGTLFARNGDESLCPSCSW